MHKITAVIVTNNRLELLKEAVLAVKEQTVKPEHIVVVDNSSTDGTHEWLAEQEGLVVLTQENSGGSGGFFSGIKKAAGLSADWIWVMDDDTICEKETLSKMIDKVALVNKPVGFIGSKALWTDGSPHLMNLPAITPSFNKKTPFNKYDQQGLLLTETTSFVSLLINIEAIKKVGLPYREFFIWGDDQEYTKRITKKGFLGFYCMESIVWHKTGINYFPDFYRDTEANLWKHNYGFRNEFFMVKKNKGIVFFLFWLVVKLIYTSLKLIVIRKDNRLKFVGTLFNSAYRAVFFNPKILYI